MILPFSIADWPELWRERFEERAAIREFDGQMTRECAEQMSEAEMRLRAEWSEMT